MGVASCHLSNILISPIHFGSKYLNNYFFKVSSVFIFPLGKPHFINSRRFLCVGNPERKMGYSIYSFSFPDPIPFHSPCLSWQNHYPSATARALSLSLQGVHFFFSLFPRISPTLVHFLRNISSYTLPRPFSAKPSVYVSQLFVFRVRIFNGTLDDQHIVAFSVGKYVLEIFKISIHLFPCNF